MQVEIYPIFEENFKTIKHYEVVAVGMIPITELGKFDALRDATFFRLGFLRALECVEKIKEESNEK